MRRNSSSRTEKLKQAMLRAKLAEQKVKTDSAAGGPLMTEEGFQEKLSQMSFKDCVEYTLAFAPPKTRDEMTEVQQSLQTPIKNLMGELAEDLLCAYDHDLARARDGKEPFDRRAFIDAFRDAMAHDDAYAQFWAGRGLKMIYRLNPDGTSRHR